MSESNFLMKYLEPVFKGIPFLRDLLKADWFIYIITIVVITAMFFIVWGKYASDEHG